MDIAGAAKRLRIYVGESDRYEGRVVHTAVLEMLRKEGYAGATVVRGIEGFGHSSRLHSASILRLSEDLPIVIDVVDSPERIESLLPRLEEMHINGLVTVEDVEVHLYGPKRVARVPPNLLVSELMTRDVITIRQDAPVSEAVEILYGHAFRALPVVDEAGHVVGILTSEDLVERAGLPFRIPLLKRLGQSLESLDFESADLAVSRVMTKPVITVPEHTTVERAARLMNHWNIKRLPVTDEDGTLQGMLSRWDLLNHAAHRPAREAEPSPEAQDATPVTVDDLMLRAVASVQVHTPIGDVLNALLDSSLRRVIVTDVEGKVVGIISDADILQAITERTQPGALRAIRARLPGGAAAAEQLRRINARSAEDVMNSAVISVVSGTSISEAARSMVDRRLMLMPVVDSEGRLAGIVSRNDVLNAISQGRV